MTFWSAVKSVFGKYATFQGRACRSEYWYFILFFVIISQMLQNAEVAFTGASFSYIAIIWSLAVWLPLIAVGARRLHDIDRTGWWLLLGFIPIIGWIILIVFECTRGTAGPNRFGQNPLA